MHEVSYQLNPLTPFWTGDIDRDSKSLRLPGLLGSLRWWYGGWIRAFGGRTCADTPQEKRCIQKPGSSICPVCRAFGCTNWNRRFSITAEQVRTTTLGFTTQEEVYPANSFWLWRTYGGDETGGRRITKGSEKLFTFGVKQIWTQQIRLTVRSCYAEGVDIINQLTFLVDFLEKWGGLGAKIQNGFGLFRLASSHEEQINQGKISLKQFAEQDTSESPNHHRDVLDIRRFFSIVFAIANFSEFANSLKNIGEPATTTYNPCAFDLRYKYKHISPSGLRERLKFGYGKAIANRLLGNSIAKKDTDRWASKIFVSHPFQTENNDWHLRIYGYIPLDIPETEILTEIIDFYIGEEGVFPGSSIVSQFNFEEYQ